MPTVPNFEHLAHASYIRGILKRLECSCTYSSRLNRNAVLHKAETHRRMPRGVGCLRILRQRSPSSRSNTVPRQSSSWWKSLGRLRRLRRGSRRRPRHHPFRWTTSSPTSSMHRTLGQRSRRTRSLCTLTCHRRCCRLGSRWQGRSRHRRHTRSSDRCSYIPPPRIRTCRR